MTPGGTRRVLVVKGRQGVSVTVVVEAYRGQVWVVSVDQSGTAEAILEVSQADSLSEALGKAACEARGGAKSRDRAVDCRSTTGTESAP